MIVVGTTISLNNRQKTNSNYKRKVDLWHYKPETLRNCELVQSNVDRSFIMIKIC